MSIEKNNKVSLLQAVMPVKIFLHNMPVFLLIMLAIVFIAIGYVNNGIMQKFRTSILDVATPVFSILSAPVQSYNSFKKTMHEAIFVYQENDRLRRENTNLKRLRTIALELEIENKRIRKLLNFIPDTGVFYTTARVVGNTVGPYRKSVVINSGVMSGVETGQVVTNKDGLVGQIIESGKGSARILLITDIASRIPVIMENSRKRAILTGNNTMLPSLERLQKNNSVMIGERIITSGDGNFFPADLPVGIIEKVNTYSVTVRPFVDFDNLEYVNIAQYTE